MLYEIGIDRLFTLGDYKNVHISVKTSGITEDQWNDQQDMDRLRSELALEVLMNFALLQEITDSNAETISSRDWLVVYQEMSENRHGPLFTNNIEIISEL